MFLKTINLDRPTRFWKPSSFAYYNVFEREKKKQSQEFPSFIQKTKKSPNQNIGLYNNLCLKKNYFFLSFLCFLCSFCSFSALSLNICITSSLIPIFEKPPSWKRFCKVTFLVKSENNVTV